MNMKIISFLAFLLFICASCGDDDMKSSVTDDDVIIGLYFGECIGDCATMYLLSGEEIFPDVIENGYSEEPAFSDEAIIVDNNIRSRFTSLGSDTPQMLLDNPGGVFGMPDAGDWGAIYYQLGETSWTLDNAIENNPEEIQDFVTEIIALIGELN